MRVGICAFALCGFGETVFMSTGIISGASSGSQCGLILYGGTFCKNNGTWASLIVKLCSARVIVHHTEHAGECKFALPDFFCKIGSKDQDLIFLRNCIWQS